MYTCPFIYIHVHIIYMRGGKETRSRCSSQLLCSCRRQSPPNCNHYLETIAKVHTRLSLVCREAFGQRLRSTHLIAGCTRTSRRATVETGAAIYHNIFKMSKRQHHEPRRRPETHAGVFWPILGGQPGRQPASQPARQAGVRSPRAGVRRPSAGVRNPPRLLIQS